MLCSYVRKFCTSVKEKRFRIRCDPTTSNKEIKYNERSERRSVLYTANEGQFNFNAKIIDTMNDVAMDYPRTKQQISKAKSLMPNVKFLYIDQTYIPLKYLYKIHFLTCK